MVYDLGRSFIALFLCMRETEWRSTHTESEKGCKRQGPKERSIGTVFGKVGYWRTYIYRSKAGKGYYPLDLELGLPCDGFSMLLRSHAVKIATKMSYAQSVAVLSMFLQWSPCQVTVHKEKFTKYHTKVTELAGLVSTL
jgi:hypothetical protein